jgi:hypothetical protein
VNDGRRHRRYKVEGLAGNVLFTSDIEILNISIDGAAMETKRRLELNREYTFKIKHKEDLLNLRGRIVWAVLVSRTKKNAGALTPVYRVGVKFTDTLSEKADALLGFIEENRIRKVEGRLGGIRFTIADSGGVKVDLPRRYEVKKLSLSGMLVETGYPMELDARHEIELFIAGNTIKITGRVAYCRKLEEKKDGVGYDIGMEILTIADNQRQLLTGFLETVEQ